jgi:competence protein ComEA
MKRIRTLALALALAAPFAVHGGQTVDINTADAETLARVIDGIGVAKAQAIIDYRQANGPFKTVEGLVAVKGIGERTVERNRDRLSVGPAASAASASATPAAPAVPAKSAAR